MEKAGGAIFKLKRQAKALITNINSFISDRYAVMLADKIHQETNWIQMEGDGNFDGKNHKTQG